MPLGEGTVLGGRYRLLSRVGRGGMGVVWHAHDDVLDRDVAIKEVLFPPGLGDAEHRVLYERTLREARSAARLNHRGIVTVHDVVEEDGRPCIVMELVKARSLQEVIDDDGRLDPIQTAEIGIQVLAALRAAHAAGITHRDVKPANVLLAGWSGDERVSAATRVVITDFGIATMEGDATLTQTGLIMGSPAYIAPERAQGEKATPASDLWSLGATLYAACEGRAPYHRTEAMAAITAIMSEEPPPPRHAGPLAPVLMGLLAKDPAVRMGAEEAAEGLRRAAHSTRPLPSPGAAGTGAPSRAPSGGAGEPPAPGPAGGPGAHGLRTHGRDGHGTQAHGAQAHGPGNRSADPAGGEAYGGEAYGGEAYGGEAYGPRARADGPAAAGSGDGPEHRGTRAPDAAPAGAARPGVPAGEPAAPRRGRRGRRGRGAAVVLAALAVAAAVVAVLLVRPWSGPGHATDGPPSAGPRSPSPTTPQVPPGYHMARGPHGSAIAVPDGWVRHALPGHDSVVWADRGTGAQIQIDCTAWETADPHEHWVRFAAKAAAGPNLPAFKAVRNGGDMLYRHWPAADLEYVWRGSRGLMHGYDRGISAGGRQYAVFVAAPQAQWAHYRRVLDAVFATFRPGSY